MMSFFMTIALITNFDFIQRLLKDDKILTKRTRRNGRIDFKIFHKFYRRDTSILNRNLQKNK